MSGTNIPATMVYPETVWSFETRNFRVAYTIAPEHDLDLSWDDDGSVRAALETCKYVAFSARVCVVHKPTGVIVGEDYLGNCIYGAPKAFIDHRGLRFRERFGVSCGSYFSDMVREAISNARKQATSLRAIKLRPA
jgi:hypothetical protein